MTRAEVQLGMTVACGDSRFVVMGMKLPDDPRLDDLWVMLAPWRGHQTAQFWRLASELKPFNAKAQRRGVAKADARPRGERRPE